MQVPPTTLKWVPLPEPIVLPPPSQLVTRTVDKAGGFPCRRCLSDGQVGDTMYLIPYNPFPTDAKDSPYQGPGPIFVHANDCIKYSKTEVSEQQRKRMLNLRAYDGEHMMVDSATLPGDGLVEKAEHMFADEKVGYLHVH